MDFASGFPGSTEIPVQFISSPQTKLIAGRAVVEAMVIIYGCYLFLLYSLFLVTMFMATLAAHTEWN